MKFSETKWTKISVLIAAIMLGFVIYDHLHIKAPGVPESTPMHVKTKQGEKGPDRLQQFKSLINSNVVYSTDKPNIALIIESRGNANDFSPAIELTSLLKSNQYHLITNLFDVNALAKKGFLAEFQKGHTEILVRSGIMSRLHHIIIGRLKFSFRQNVENNID